MNIFIIFGGVSDKSYKTLPCNKCDICIIGVGELCWVAGLSLLWDGGGSVSSLREIIIWMLALEDCDVVTASGWEWSNPHPPNIDNP